MPIALLLLAADPLAVRLQPATLRLDAACTTACEAPAPRSRYRLDPQANTDPDRKRVALAHDGTTCDVVGAKLCTSKPRRLFATDFTD